VRVTSTGDLYFASRIRKARTSW